MANYNDLFKSDAVGASASVFEQYLRLYNDLVALNSEVNTYLPLSCDVIARSRNVPLLGWMLGVFGAQQADAQPAPMTSLLCGNQADSYYKSFGKGYGGPDSPAANAQAAPSSIATSPIASSSPALPRPDGSLAQTASGSASSGVKKYDMQWAELLFAEQQQRADFLVKAGITGAVGTEYVSNFLPWQIYYCQQLATLLGIWVLPALYGILGAIVFQMRAILSPIVPDPTLERVLLRLAIGGLAGISILLVFGSTSSKILEGASSFGIGSFGLAFLLGFSVDVFFKILDRVVTAISRSLEPPVRQPSPRAGRDTA